MFKSGWKMAILPSYTGCLLCVSARYGFHLAALSDIITQFKDGVCVCVFLWQVLCLSARFVCFRARWVYFSAELFFQCYVSVSVPGVSVWMPVMCVTEPGYWLCVSVPDGCAPVPDMCLVVTDECVSVPGVCVSVPGVVSTVHHYVMSVHSSKRLLVEEISTFRNRHYETIMADAIIQLAVKQGRREEVSETAYSGHSEIILANTIGHAAVSNSRQVETSERAVPKYQPYWESSGCVLDKNFHQGSQVVWPVLNVESTSSLWVVSCIKMFVLIFSRVLKFLLCVLSLCFLCKTAIVQVWFQAVLSPQSTFRWAGEKNVLDTSICLHLIFSLCSGVCVFVSSVIILVSLFGFDLHLKDLPWLWRI